MLPVPKKATWMRKKKKRATRVSARFRGRKTRPSTCFLGIEAPSGDAFSEEEFFVECCVDAEDLKTRFSILTQMTNVMQKTT